MVAIHKQVKPRVVVVGTGDIEQLAPGLSIKMAKAEADITLIRVYEHVPEGKAW